MKNNRSWQIRHGTMPEAEIDSDRVTIENVRNFRWEEDGIFEENYETREYVFEDLNGVWFGVDPFESGPPAHIFLSFSFEESENLVISVEARVKKGQEFGFVKGATYQFGLIYVIADEKDALGERVGSQDNYIQLYPVDTKIDTIRSVFIDMLERANKIRREPENYNIVWNSCSRNLLFHSDKFVDNSPDYFQTMQFCLWPNDKLYEWDSIKTDKPIEDMKKPSESRTIHRKKSTQRIFRYRFGSRRGSNLVPALSERDFKKIEVRIV